MNDLQKLVDTISDLGRRDRSKYHLTLGALIEALDEQPGEKPVVFGGAVAASPGGLDSYRGYYSDLSFEPSLDPVNVEELRKDAKAALGKSFIGYKGGDFVMNEETPLWVSEYGECSDVAVMQVISTEDSVVLATKRLRDEED